MKLKLQKPKLWAEYYKVYDWGLSYKYDDLESAKEFLTNCIGLLKISSTPDGELDIEDVLYSNNLEEDKGDEKDNKGGWGAY